MKTRPMMDKLKQSMAASERSESRWLTTTSLVILAGVAVAFALSYTRPIMIPFVLALFIVIIVSPIMDFQMLVLRFPRVLAVTVTLIVVILIISLVGLLLTEVVDTVVSTADGYGYLLERLALETYDQLVKFRNWFEFRGEEGGDVNDVSEANAPKRTGGVDGAPDAGVKERRPTTFQVEVDEHGVLRIPPLPEYVELEPTEGGGLLVDVNAQKDANGIAAGSTAVNEPYRLPDRKSVV